MKVLCAVPWGLKKINERFGSPDTDGDGVPDRHFINTYLDYFKLPFPLKLSWKETTEATRILSHIDVGPSIIDALKEIVEYRGHTFLTQNRYDIFGGTYNFRKMRGYGALSTHSWGIAIDMVPHLGSFGKSPQLPEFMISAFEKRGFVWGGRWKSPYTPDGMHFQACRGY